MDLNKLLSSINNLNDYILATEKLQKCESPIIPLTMSVVLNLNKNRSLEIEFFNKCEGNGITFLVVQHLLKQPPSKTWRLLGKELIPMVHYWLEAVRKHLISHNPQWWSFLATLLKFIQDIKVKDHHPTKPATNKIVELTTECLLDIACNSQLDENQREQVLRCVNLCSAESSRELRSRLRGRLNTYFVKLGTILSSCGHFPTQLCIMELLLRWLVRRHEPTLRSNAACAWFPKQLFSSETIAIFLEATWKEFYQDARRFLNSHNVGREPQMVTSVICESLSVGRVTLFHATSSDACIWIDINCATTSITVYLDLRNKDDAGDSSMLDTLTVTEDNTMSVELKRQSDKTIMVVQTVQPPSLTYNQMQWDGDKCNLRALVNGDPQTLDTALRKIFHFKYMGLIDYGTAPCSPFQKPKSVSGDPAPRGYRSGYAVRCRDPMSWSSPSTASTTSLAQLREKLTALPPLQYNRTTQKISITPDLPVVREVSEYEDVCYSLSKPRRGKVAVKNLSDTEAKSRPGKKERIISPVINKNSASLLFSSTLGTTDESVINDTFNQIYNYNTTVDLVDLLDEQFLQNEQDKDSGIISGQRTHEPDVIENTPVEINVRHKKLTLKRRARSTDVSNTITGESDPDVIEDTPCYVYDRRKTVQTYTSKKVTNSVIGDEIITLDDAKFEEFFSQHVTEHKAGYPAISPTVAKKLYEPSSEASEDIAKHFTADHNVYNDRLDNIDLVSKEETVACLTSIIDKVCSDIENCAVSINAQQHQIDSLKSSRRRDKSSKIASDISKTYNSVLSNDGTTKFTQDNKKITLKFQQSKFRTKGSKMNTKQKKGKRDKEPSNVEEINISTENTSTNSPINNEALLTRKKRKLYSPKDGDNDNEIPRAKMERKQANICQTPIAACYKELEMARKTQTRFSGKTRYSTELISTPKSKKSNDLFDKIKDNLVNNEEVTLVKKLRNKKDLAVYNLSSESEDGDYKKKKKQKREVSNSSLESSRTKRRIIKKIKPTNYCEYNSISSSEAEKEVKRAKKKKMVKNTKPRSRKVNIEPNINLIDEKMRAATHEVMETSFIRQTSDQHAHELEEPDPALKHAPVMEMLPGYANDVEPDTTATGKTIKTRNQSKIKIKKEKGASKNIEKHAKTLVAKRDKTLNNKMDIIADVPKEKDSTTVSPLPGLVIETEKSRKDDLTSSLDANLLLKKFKNIYTEVQDLNETDRTQNALIGEDLNDDAALESIATGGMSPITGHNDLNESPPNVKSLEETIEHRDADIERLGPDLAEFLVNMRKQFNANTENIENKTSPVLPFTRMSARESAMSVTSNTSIPRVVKNLLPSEDIEIGVNHLATPKSAVSQKSNKRRRKVGATKSPSADVVTNPDPVITPRSNASSAKVVTSKKSSEIVEKYSNPAETPKSSTGKSVSVVLERISGDEIDRWLPIPQSKDIEHKPKKYNTRQATSKPTGVTKRTPEEVVLVERKIKSVISPVKLNFNIPEMTERHKSKLSPYKTRSSTRSIQCHTTKIDKDKDKVIIIDSEKSTDDKIAEQSSNNSFAETRDKLKDKIPALSVNASDVNFNSSLSETSKSAAIVNEWLNKHASSSITADNVTIKESVHKVIEMLETTLPEIHKSTSESLSKAYLQIQEDINVLKEDTQRSFEGLFSSIQRIETKLKTQACEVLRSDAEKKVLMVNLLKDDMQAVLDYLDKQ